jgi:hypothetical protein
MARIGELKDVTMIRASQGAVFFVLIVSRYGFSREIDLVPDSETSAIPIAGLWGVGRTYPALAYIPIVST